MVRVESDTNVKKDDASDTRKSLPAIESLDKERRNAGQDSNTSDSHPNGEGNRWGIVWTFEEAEAELRKNGTDVRALVRIGTTKPIPMNLPPDSVVVLPTSLMNTDLSNADLSRTYISQDDQFVKISDALLKLNDEDAADLISNSRFSRTGTKWSEDPVINDAVNQRLKRSGIVVSTTLQGEAEPMDRTFDDILSKKAVGRVDESLLNKYGITIAKSESEKTTVPRFVSEQEAERRLLRGEPKPKKKPQDDEFGQDDR